MADFTIKANDRLPSIQASLLSAGTPVDLTGASSVKFILTSAVGATPKVNATAVIVDAVTGVVRYDWLAIDTAVAGSYLAEWQVTWTTGTKPQTFPTASYHSVDILADLGS